MIRLVIVAVALFLLLVGGSAIALYEYLGWKGLALFPFAVLLLVWMAKIIIGRLIKAFALGLFSIKSKVLRNATVEVHSITAVPKPEDASAENAGKKNSDEAKDDSSADKHNEREYNYFVADLTITPADANSEAIWEPSEMILTSEKVKGLADIEGKEIGHIHDLLIWNESKFEDDEVGKYPGKQRLKITFAVKIGTSTAFLQYYNEPVGVLHFSTSAAPIGVG
jgi:hypothetical protein